MPFLASIRIAPSAFRPATVLDLSRHLVEVERDIIIAERPGSGAKYLPALLRERDALLRQIETAKEDTRDDSI